MADTCVKCSKNVTMDPPFEFALELHFLTENGMDIKTIHILMCDDCGPDLTSIVLNNLEDDDEVVHLN